MSTLNAMCAIVHIQIKFLLGSVFILIFIFTHKLWKLYMSAYTSPKGHWWQLIYCMYCMRNTPANFCSTLKKSNKSECCRVLHIFCERTRTITAVVGNNFLRLFFSFFYIYYTKRYYLLLSFIWISWVVGLWL